MSESDEREWHRRVEMPLPVENEKVEFELSGKQYKGWFSGGMFHDDGIQFGAETIAVNAWRPLPVPAKLELPACVENLFEHANYIFKSDLVPLFDPCRPGPHLAVVSDEQAKPRYELQHEILLKDCIRHHHELLLRIPQWDDMSETEQVRWVVKTMAEEIPRLREQLADLRGRYDKQLDYSTNMQRLVERICNRSEIPKELAAACPYHAKKAADLREQLRLRHEATERILFHLREMLRDEAVRKQWPATTQILETDIIPSYRKLTESDNA